MEEITRRLNEQLERLNSSPDISISELKDIKEKLKLYIDKSFDNPRSYNSTISKIDFESAFGNDIMVSKEAMKSLITTLIQDIELSQMKGEYISPKEIAKIKKDKEENELEKARIRKEAEQIEKLISELELKKQNLVNESEKFDEFKKKLEISDKGLDFQAQAARNKNNAVGWTIAFFIFTSFLILTLFCSLNDNSTFSKIANGVKLDMHIDKQYFLEGDLISKTVYITFLKFIFTKLLLYSIILFAIVFCVKNYNAQMHNHIINSHKSNALNSTLSLLNTAKSEEGNDKLLIQATQAIFSHQQSGYNGKESETSSPNLITNVIDAAAKKL